MVKRYVELRNKHGLTPEEAAYFKVYIDDYIPVSGTSLSVIPRPLSMDTEMTRRLTAHLPSILSPLQNRCIFTNVTATLPASMYTGTYQKKFTDSILPSLSITAMFLPVLRSQASDDQLKVWGPQAENYHYIGW